LPQSAKCYISVTLNYDTYSDSDGQSGAGLDIHPEIRKMAAVAAVSNVLTGPNVMPSKRRQTECLTHKVVYK